MGSLCTRLWGPMSHQEFNRPIYKAGWLKVLIKDENPNRESRAIDIQTLEANPHCSNATNYSRTVTAADAQTNASTIKQSTFLNALESFSRSKLSKEVQWSLKDLFVILQSDKIIFFEGNPFENPKEKPLKTFLVFRKNGVLQISESTFQFTLLLQDQSAKLKAKKLRFTCAGQQDFQEWITEVKKTQRPKWTDPEADFCFICEANFSFIRRQHHCRKCGTAVCAGCSNFFVPLFDLAYEERVRVCRNCIICLQKQKEKERKSEVVAVEFVNPEEVQRQLELIEEYKSQIDRKKFKRMLKAIDENSLEQMEVKDSMLSNSSPSPQLHVLSLDRESGSYLHFN